MTDQHYPPHAAHPNPIGADDGGARALAITVLVLGALYTVGSVSAEVPFTLAALDYADRANPSDLTLLAAGVLGVGSSVLLLPLWIVTCLWIRAERLRLTRLDGGHFAHGTTGTFFSWIVPLANLVWPYRIVRELHDAAVEPAHRVSLGGWWTAWILALVLDRVSTGLYDDQALGDPAGAIVVTALAASLMSVVAFVLWLRVVQAISRGTGRAWR